MTSGFVAAPSAANQIPVGGTYGVDEAGRGPVLGPMAIAVVELDSRSECFLRSLGVADSKRFGSGAKAQAHRARLSGEIRSSASSHSVELVSVETVDRYTFRGLLNQLERETVLALLQRVGADHRAHIICDGARMFSPLRERYARLLAVDKGESFHIAVAAASILAKTARDLAFNAIATRYEADFGPVRGGGYVNAGTREFLARYAERHDGALPPEVRRSWGAAKRRGVAAQPVERSPLR
ncbi:MAG: hypothetical protein V3V08_03180 [Nannocystaceae bacterium]